MGIEEDFYSRFVNPYNFIPLLKQCDRFLPETIEGDKYTGYFECGIRLLTPLFIPNTSSHTRLIKPEELRDRSCEKEGWKGYDFYSYEDLSKKETCDSWPLQPPSNPVIPGSEIRGALRSVYEAAFNGCMSSVYENRVLSRRTNVAKKPGIIKERNGQWYLYPCKKAMLLVESNKIKESSERMGKMVPLVQYKKWKEGQEIWIKVDDFFKKFKNTDKAIGKKVTDYKTVNQRIVGDMPDSCDDISEKNGEKNWKQGWLHKGERFTRKHHESVFYEVENSSKKAIKVESTDIDRLKAVLREYRDVKKNHANKTIGNWYDEFEVSPKGTLVYYSEAVDGHIYLSPACIGKEIFIKTIGDLLKNNGAYQPCNSRALCPACLLFGIVNQGGGNNTFAYGSKVRVTDAKLCNSSEDSSKLFEKPIILPELGEPRPGTVEFYTKAPYQSAEKTKEGRGYWTYDYKHVVNKKGVTLIRETLSQSQPELRGRKFYWHSNVDLMKYKETNGNKLKAMKQRVRPMKAQEIDSDPIFYFRLYFEQLNKDQLRQLKWMLDFDNPECAHKIGRAKPLGFGSVQITVGSINLRKIIAETGQWVMERPNIKEFLEPIIPENKSIKTVVLMANWKKRPANVGYPLGETIKRDGKRSQNDSVSHQWFTINRGNISKPEFKKLLPEPEEEIKEKPDKVLFKLIKKE